MYRSPPSQHRSRSRDRERHSHTRSRSSSGSGDGGHRSKQRRSGDPASPGLRRVKSGRSFHPEARSTQVRSRSPRHRRERRRSSDEDRPAPRPRSRSPEHLSDRRRRPRDDEDDEDRSELWRRDERSGRSRRSSRSRSRSPRRRDAPRNGPPARRDEPPPPTNVVEKQQPNFGRSGKLAADTNTVAGTEIVLKYHEPAEARLPPPSRDWRMYEFKGKDTLSTTELSSRSCWLVGRESAVVDFLVQHPSCSAQHAVLQFRFVEKSNEFGERIGRVKLYVLDLESANGTRLNGERIEERRFIEVRSGDVLRFGDSTREYVILLAQPEASGSGGKGR
jgi:smad nuclear-interacting protein 1